MKLMIDIPEILFEKIQNRKTDKQTLETIIMRGIPQEPILDKIRAEITEYAIPDFEYHGCGGSQKIVELEDVLQIIDKYKGEADCRECKAENECYYCKKYEESEDK